MEYLTDRRYCHSNPLTASPIQRSDVVVNKYRTDQSDSIPGKEDFLPCIR